MLFSQVIKVLILLGLFTLHQAATSNEQSKSSPPNAVIPTPASTPGAPQKGSTADSSFIDQLMSKLTLTQMVGQMVQLDIKQVVINGNVSTANLERFTDMCIGSLFDGFLAIKEKRYNLDASEFRAIISQIQDAAKKSSCSIPMFFALDSVHGAGYIGNATVLPHALTLASSFNVDLFLQAGQITGEETLAASETVTFSVFADMALLKSWARVGESPSECPFLTTEYVRYLTRGIQQGKKIAACVKHLFGYSAGKMGFDRADATLDIFALHNYVLKPYMAAIEENVAMVMEGYNSLNRKPVLADRRIIEVLLREKLGFKGVVISDYQEPSNLQSWHRLVETESEALRLAIMNTLDINMAATSVTSIPLLVKLAEENPDIKARITASVRRILELKQNLNLFENAVPGAEYLLSVGSKEHKDAALQMALESIVLLKNKNNILPLKKQAKVLVIGESFNNTGMLMGAWTVEWQGRDGNNNYKGVANILEAFRDIGASVEYVRLFFANGTYDAQQLQSVKSKASSYDVILFTVGEVIGTEKPADIFTLAFPDGIYEVAEATMNLKVPVILLLLSSRPRLLRDMSSKADAIIYAGRPGQFGAQAIADIIYGVKSPSARLPFTYPKYDLTSTMVYYESVSTQCASSNNCDAEFAFGSGKTYCPMKYSAITLSSNSISRHDKLTASVTVTNSGQMTCKEVVLLFATQPYRLIREPEKKLLVGFQKIELSAGQSKTVQFTLDEDNWTVYASDDITDLTKYFENTKFVLSVGPDIECNVYATSVNQACAKFSVSDSATQS